MTSGKTKPPKLPSEDEIARLADLARVPQEKERRRYFSDFILNVLLSDLRFFWELPMNRPDNAAVSHAVQAVHSAKLAIANLDRKDREILVGPSFASEIDGFLFRAEGKQTLARHQAIRRGTNRRGRRSGTIRYQGLYQLVESLLCVAERTGGQFTLEKNNECGTLVDAICLLTPYIPAGVVPQALPYSTLQRIKTAHAQASREKLARIMERISG